jgi:hypothetical protein
MGLMSRRCAIASQHVAGELDGNTRFDEEETKKSIDCWQKFQLQVDARVATATNE